MENGILLVGVACVIGPIAIALGGVWLRAAVFVYNNLAGGGEDSAVANLPLGKAMVVAVVFMVVGGVVGAGVYGVAMAVTASPDKEDRMDADQIAFEIRKPESQIRNRTMSEIHDRMVIRQKNREIKNLAVAEVVALACSTLFITIVLSSLLSTTLWRGLLVTLCFAAIPGVVGVLLAATLFLWALMRAPLHP